MVPTEKLLLTKLDVVRRQLATAIDLYFEDGDPVSIHTLALAAYNVLRDLNKDEDGMPMNLKGAKGKQNVQALLTGPLYDYVREDKRKCLRDLLVEPENFFKHADRDPNEVLVFHQMATEMFMWEAVVVFEKLTRELPHSFWCYRTWFHMIHPEGFDYPPEIMRKMQDIDASSRQMFRDQVFPLMIKHVG